MQTIKDNQSLAKAITQLELDQASEWNLLKQHFHFTVDSLNPVNMIKEKFHDVITSPDLTGNLIKGAIGIGTGMLTNRFIVGSSNSFVKKALANVVQNNIPNLNMGTVESLKETGISFLKNTLKKMKIKS